MHPSPAHLLAPRPILAALLAALTAAGCTPPASRPPGAGVAAAASAPPTAAAHAASAAAPGERCVTILSTNDMHGAVEPHELEASGAHLRYGGVLTLGSYIEAVRAREPGRVLLLDAGDIYQGSVVSNLSSGRAMIAAMNALGYDASAIGNHEFDFGAGDEGDPAAAAAPAAAPEARSRDPLAVVKARIADARFPFLAANLRERATGSPVSWANLHPTLLIERGGVKVGIVGVSTPDTPRLTRPQNVASLEFADPVRAVAAAAAGLRARGAELVVVLGHMGGDCKRLDDPHDLSSCDPDSEMFRLVHALPRGTVDVAVGGHTHQRVASWVDGVAVTEAGSRARALGWIDACVAPGGGIDVARSRVHAPVPLCLDAWPDGTCNPRPGPGVAAVVRPASFLGRTVTSSAELASVLAPYRDQVAAEVRRPIGAYLDRPLALRAPDGSSPLGEAVLAAMRAAAGVDIAVQNRGGIRVDLPAGEITYGEVFEAVPFDNRVAVLELEAAQLEALVRHVTARSSDAPLVSGLRVVREGGRIEVRLADGSPLVGGRRYAVVTNDYLAQGGEGLDKVLGDLGPRVRVLDLEVRTALVDYLSEVHPSRHR